MTAKLFSPISIKGITLKNRIIVSPMCQYSATDGFAGDWHLVHLGSRAVGGAALIMTEATAVSPEGRISLRDLGIWKDAHIDKLQQVTSFIKQQGAVCGIQLAHAGRKASTEIPWEGNGKVDPENGGWQVVAPSALAYSDSYPQPLALDIAGIRKVIEDFGHAALRAVQAGFQIIEIHAAHGYLLHQFLSPLSNIRKDEYGGSFENRIRLLLQIIEHIRSVVPDGMPLFVRISATDWVDGGWNPEESVRLSKILKSKGVDLMDISSGGLSRLQKIPAGPAYQTPFAAEIKRQTGILTSAVGLITDATQAESILMTEQADLIMMARELLRDPYFSLRAAHELKDTVAWPRQYERAHF